jgi:hypothetical protein
MTHAFKPLSEMVEKIIKVNELKLDLKNLDVKKLDKK